MSKSESGLIADQRPLWLFRGIADGAKSDELIAAARDQGRVERWGHAARVPLFAKQEEIVLIADGTVVVDGAPEGPAVRLTRGDAFGLTPGGQLTTTNTSDALVVETIRETTIITIGADELRQIWDHEQVRRAVRAGRWLGKEVLEVPLWPLLGAKPTTRLARILIHLVENYGEIQGDRGRLSLLIKPGQLAELAGLDKKRAAQVWRLFRGAQMVAVDGGALIVTDLSKMRDYARAG